MSRPAFSATPLGVTNTVGRSRVEGVQPESASSAAPASTAAVSPNPCGLPGACESSDPTYRVYYSSSFGDSSSCTFELHIEWGDGSQETDTTAGAPAGVLVLIGSHTYGAPGTYPINVTGRVVSGPCTVSPSVAQFTLARGGPSRSEQGAAENPSQNPTTCSAARPVNCATGTFWHTFTDASIPGLGIPLDLSRTYSSSGAATNGPLGYGWTDSYGMYLGFEGTNVTVVQENGSTVPFYGTSGTYFPGAGVLATLVKNGDGTYTFTRDSTHARYVFSSAGRLLEEIDRNGHKTMLSYTGSNLTKVTDPAGRSLTFTYSGAHLVSVSDPMGHVTTYAYDAAGNLASTVDPLGRTWSFTYDANHRLVTMKDPRGGVTTNTYDGAGRVTGQVDPMGRTTTWSYTGEPESAGGGTTTITDPRGDQTREQYADLELTAITAGFGTSEAATTSFEYDMATLGRAKITDPEGGVTTQTYDSRGDLLSRRDPLGREAEYTYDGDGDLLTSTDPRGTTTTYSYDSGGNLLSRSTPVAGGEAAKWSFTYGSGVRAGERLTAEDPVGDTTHFDYDAAGDVTSVTDPLGHQATAGYDEDGRLLSQTTPGGKTTTYVYDAAGELTGETGPLGEATVFGYDPDGNQTKIVDADGQTTHQVFDADNELTEVIRPDGSAVKTTWDAAGNMTAQIDGAGHVTSYGYDALGRRTSMTDPDGRTTTYGYDGNGNRTRLTGAEGEITSYGYDADDESISISYSDGETPAVTEEYDSDGNRTRMTDGTGISTFTYDSLNRMTSTTDGSGATVEYAYDLAGRITKLTYPNGQTVDRAFDADGNLTGVTDWLGHTTQFRYDPDSDLGETLYGNGVTAQLGYDGADRLTSIVDQRGGVQLAGFSYTRDALGQVTRESSEDGGPQAVDYTRDPLGQITAANSLVYGYDGADNPTTLGSASQHFDPAGQLISIGTGEAPEEKGEVETAPPGSGTTPPAVSPPSEVLPPPVPPKPLHCRKGFRKQQKNGKARCVRKKKKRKGHSRKTRHRAKASKVVTQAPRTSAAPGSAQVNQVAQVNQGVDPASTEVTRHFAYNARGDRISEERADGTSRILAYDQADRLIAVGSGVTYAYDGSGLRASKTVGGVTTDEVWSAADALPELLQSGTTSYVYGPGGRPIEQISGGSATFIQSDQQGSTRLLTDESGNVAGRYAYDPWGTVMSHTGSASSELQFDGQQTDAETGFQYLRGRYLDPATAQFLTRDPIAGVTRASYQFAANDPVDEFDPLGLFDWRTAVAQTADATGAASKVSLWFAGALAVTADPLAIPVLAVSQGIEIVHLGAAWALCRYWGEDCGGTFIDGALDATPGKLGIAAGVAYGFAKFSVDATTPDVAYPISGLTHSDTCTSSDPSGSRLLLNSDGWIDPHQAVWRNAP